MWRSVVYSYKYGRILSNEFGFWVIMHDRDTKRLKWLENDRFFSKSY